MRRSSLVLPLSEKAWRRSYCTAVLGWWARGSCEVTDHASCSPPFLLIQGPDADVVMGSTAALPDLQDTWTTVHNRASVTACFGNTERDVAWRTSLSTGRFPQFVVWAPNRHSMSDAATLDVSRLQCCAIASNAAKGGGKKPQCRASSYFCLWSFEIGATSSCFSHSNLGLMWPTNGSAWNPICDPTLSCQTKDQFRWSTVEEIKDKSKTLAWVCLHKFTFLFLRLFLFPISLPRMDTVYSTKHTIHSSHLTGCHNGWRATGT